ncbi:hypothetical protein LGM65_20815 [Burkholderia anthina]|uniref:hypothetical protein n=1 Tax=Burkholderia anthina TaxID=179879 RepID=UPI001CF4B097|nr:hypothetical protein [Burkholderia anthina]MCA8093301.1 hypothetical protein [Burkholderia anthina]
MRITDIRDRAEHDQQRVAACADDRNGEQMGGAEIERLMTKASLGPTDVNRPAPSSRPSRKAEVSSTSRPAAS